MSKPPPLPGQENTAKLKRELTIFFFFLALLLGAAAYWMLNSDSVGKEPILGFKRSLAWGVPTLAIAVAHGMAGVLLLLGLLRSSIVIGCMAATALAIFYAGIMMLSTGEFPISLITLVVIATPVLVMQRSIVFLRLQQREHQHQELK